MTALETVAITLLLIAVLPRIVSGLALLAGFAYAGVVIAMAAGLAAFDGVRDWFRRVR